MIRLEHGDCREIIPALEVKVDAVVTDPPYHLIPTLKRFGAENSAPAQHGKDGAMARLSGGFMGQQWDGGDIAFRPETWATIGSALRPGGFLLAFGGTRTYHRLACAIEDAGFVIQDCLMWLFATGFPKRRDMLKPAYEPIILAYKPGGKRTMQVDECRIEAADHIGSGGSCKLWSHYRDEKEPSAKRRYPRSGGTDFAALPGPRGGSPTGRWPANICHDGSDEVIAAFPESNSTRVGNPNNPTHGVNDSRTSWEFGPLKETNDFRDTGSAARFFFSSKAGSQDRWGSRHPTVKPVELMKWLVQLVAPAGGLVLDPFAGSGTTGVAALATGRDAILIEREDQYIADIRERLAFYEGGDRHSAASKMRNAKAKGDMPLFE